MCGVGSAQARREKGVQGWEKKGVRRTPGAAEQNIRNGKSAAEAGPIQLRRVLRTA